MAAPTHTEWADDKRSWAASREAQKGTTVTCTSAGPALGVVIGGYQTVGRFQRNDGTRWQISYNATADKLDCVQIGVN